MHDTTTPFLRPASLWFGMSAAPAAWTIHLLLLWSITEFGCQLGFGARVILGISTLQLLVVTVGLIALATAVYSGIVAYRNWQELESIDAEERHRFNRGVLRGQFMALTGMAFSALFTLVMLYMTAPMFVLPPCQP